MMPIYRYISCLLLLLGLLSLSLPADARRKRDPLPQKSKETIFMETYFPERPCREWEKGKRFIYLDNELSPLIQPRDISTSDSSYRGKIFLYEGMAEASPWRTGTVNLLFSCDGHKYTFKTGKSREEIQNTTYTPLLPMLVADEDVCKAQLLLVGKTLYTRPATWVDSVGNTSANRRYCPVKIIDIQPGNSIYPIAFVFRDADSSTYRIFGSLTQTSRMQAATFDRLFTFDNPRSAHEDISDEHWRLITYGRVTEGMTKEECRLSLGNPQNAREIPTYSGLKEEWYYRTGAYLFFEDGKLSRYR